MQEFACQQCFQPEPMLQLEAPHEDVFGHAFPSASSVHCQYSCLPCQKPLLLNEGEEITDG